jgi:hypothetical protein
MTHQLKGRVSATEATTVKPVFAVMTMPRGREEAGVAPLGVMMTTSLEVMEGTAIATATVPVSVEDPARERPFTVSSETVSVETRDEFARTLAYDILFYTC